MYKGKAILLDGTSVGEVDGLTEGAFGLQGLIDNAHGTLDVGKVTLLRRHSSIAVSYI